VLDTNLIIHMYQWYYLATYVKPTHKTQDTTHISKKKHSTIETYALPDEKCGLAKINNSL